MSCWYKITRYKGWRIYVREAAEGGDEERRPSMLVNDSVQANPVWTVSVSDSLPWKKCSPSRGDEQGEWQGETCMSFV